MLIVKKCSEIGQKNTVFYFTHVSYKVNGEKNENRPKSV